MYAQDALIVRTAVRAGRRPENPTGGSTNNHNETLARSVLRAVYAQDALIIRTNVRAGRRPENPVGGATSNHNETLARSVLQAVTSEPSLGESQYRGQDALVIRTNVRAGFHRPENPTGGNSTNHNETLSSAR